MHDSPLVSVLIATYNRSAVLRRAIQSVLAQSFENFELVIIDDCSTDQTAAVVHSFNDPRIRYLCNAANVASLAGDRPHVRRFVHELMRGQYFVYLCDDDYWPNSTLLSRQVQAFLDYENVAMVIGGQLSQLVTDESASALDTDTVCRFDYQDLYTKAHPAPPFFLKGLYPQTFMRSAEFLTIFANDPIVRNIIAGATLYSRKHFIASGALSSEQGAKWQAGYEFSMTPACCGNVVYFDEPAIIVDVRPQNASFRSTQVGHYKDSIKSIKIALNIPTARAAVVCDHSFLKKIKKNAIRKVSHAYLSNTISVKLYGGLTICGRENLSEMVRAYHVLCEYVLDQIILNREDIIYLCQASLPKSIVLWLKRWGHRLRKRRALLMG